MGETMCAKQVKKSVKPEVFPVKLGEGKLVEEPGVAPEFPKEEAVNGALKKEPVQPITSRLRSLKEDAKRLSEAEEEIPEVIGKKRHKMTPWLWWVAAMLGTVILLVSGVTIVNGWRNRDVTWELRETSNDETELPEEETPEEEPDHEPATEPKEPEKEESAKEEPGVAPEPPKKEEPLQPIAPRPETPSEDATTGKKLIALTFDDGPSPYTTPRLLDVLKGRDVKATFFVLGTMAQKSPEILRREANDGHEVASHTMYHNQLTLLSANQIRAEAVEMDRIFTEILGTRPPFTRPPYGAFNAAVGEALGQPAVLWSIDPRDWADRNASIVCSRVTGAARDGAIILVHDIHATTVDAVPCIIDTLRSWGYEFVTVSGLAAAKGVKLMNGVGYYAF